LTAYLRVDQNDSFHELRAGFYGCIDSNTAAQTGADQDTRLLHDLHEELSQVSQLGSGGEVINMPVVAESPS
jgi:hypothetical protein